MQNSHAPSRQVTRLPHRPSFLQPPWPARVLSALAAAAMLIPAQDSMAAPPSVATGTLTVWLDATDVNGNGTTPANGAAVATWVNKAGGVGNFTGSAGGSVQPSFTAASAAFNGQPVVHFTAGTGKALQNTANFGNNVTVFYVGRKNGTDSGRLVTSIANNWLLGYWNTAMNCSFWGQTLGGNYQGSGTADNVAHVWAGYANGAAFYAYRVDSGIETLIDSRSGATVEGPNGLSLGFWGSGSEVGGGDIGELLVYSGALSQTDRANIEAYLLGRWFSNVPTIASLTPSTTAYAGEFLTLSVTVGGAAPLVHQWMKDGAPIANATNASLPLPGPLTTNEAASYSVVVTNAHGGVTGSVVVAVLPVTGITNGLAAWWKFDEASGATAADSAPGASHGALINFPGDNSQWIAGQIGGALRFRGASSGDYIAVANYPKPVSTMTVSAWVWADARPTWATIIKNWPGGNGQFHFGLQDTAGDLSNWLYQQGGAAIGPMREGAGQPLPLGTWQHVAFVCDGRTMRLYRNGGEVATLAYNGTIQTNAINQSLHIGAKWITSGTVDSHWQGRMDDLALWRRGLTPAEILAIYAAGLGGQNLSQASTTPPAGSVGITEFMAANGGTLRDSDGDSSDWIEIYNGTDGPVNLADWSLTDNPANPTKWHFPATNLAAHGYLIVFASEKNRAVPGAELHTNFKLSAGGEYLALRDAQTNLISEFAPVFPPQVDNVSFGLARPATTNEPPGSTNYAALFRYFVTPTPGFVNVGGVEILGPLISSAGHWPAQPLDADALVVTARVAQALSPVAGVTLHYRVMFSNEVALPMADDGAHGDGLAGDGLFGATIPAAAASPGQMVRYYFSALDSQSRTSRAPLFLDAAASPQYFGTVVRDLSVTSALPVLDWFVENAAAADTDAGTACSVFHNGEFYDNVHVRIRGDTARSWPKKSYKFDFNDGSHFQIAPGLDRVSEINLNGTYTDKAFLRAPLAYEAYRDAASPASLCWNLHLRQNAAFYSVAVFVEQPDKDYLRRQGLDPNGALYKRASGSADPGLPASSVFYEKKTREWEDKSDLQAFLNGISPSTPADARRRFVFDNVNLPQVVNYMAACIVVQNIDRTVKNYYLYRDSDGSREWQMFPWDVDLSFGPNALNTDVIEATDDTAPDRTSHPYFGAYDHQFNGLWNYLLDAIVMVPETRAMFLRRIRTLADSRLAGGWFEARINAMLPPLNPDVLLDHARWGANAHFPGATYTLQQAADRIKNEYLAPRRTHLLTNHVAGSGYPDNAGLPAAQPTNVVISVCAVEANPATGNQLQEYVCLTNPHPFAVELTGWRVRGAIEHDFAPGTVMPSNSVLFLSPNVVEFRARLTGPSGNQALFVQGNYRGQLSARGETLLVQDATDREVSRLTYPGAPSLAQQFLRVTELMYHPALPLSGTNTAEDFEFIEIKNTSTNATLDLTGVRFTTGITFDFSAGSVSNLAPGQAVLLVKNLAAFVSRHGSGLNVAGQYTGFLDNNGERLVLVDARNEEILDFAYDRAWHPSTHGSGLSLVVVDEHAEPDAWSRAANWRPSSAVGGSPGADDPAPPVLAPIRVNEVLTASVPPATDVIELFNPTGADVDVGGWFLTDDSFAPKKYRIPTNTVIAAHGYRVFTETNFNAGGAGFALGSDGDEVFLFSGDASTNLTGYSHGFSFGAAEPGITLGRHVTSAGVDHFVAQSTNTLGGTNAGPLVGPVVIRQIMFHPPDLAGGVNNTNDEFIELANTSTNAVPLFDVTLPTNTWHLRGGVAFDFPTNVSLASTGSLLLVGFAPTNSALRSAFFAKYTTLTNLPLHGPWSGSLDNVGDAVRLNKPGVPTTNGVPRIIVEEVNFAVTAPWPTNTGGSGLTLLRRDLTAYANDPTNWTGDAPLVILAQPVSQSVNAGATVNFTVNASGNGPLSYQWRLNGTNLPNATNATFTLLSAQMADAGTYTVRVADSTRVAESSPAQLAVLARPAILQQPQSQIVALGSIVLLSVSAEGTAPMGFRWLRNAIAFTNNTTGIITWSNIQFANAGRYSVQVTNPALPTLPGTSSANAYISVVLPPTNRTTAAGANVSLSAGVGAASGSTPRYQWHFNGGPIAGATATNLVFASIQPSNSGLYTIWITNTVSSTNVGSPAGFSARLTVDSDGDGLPDDWELAFGLNPTNAVDANADADGDTMLNWEEHIAGTNPTNALSVLRLEASSVANGVQLGFEAVSNRAYAVQFLQTLGGANWSNLALVPAQPVTFATNVLDSTIGSNRFYRILIPAGPAP